MSNLKAILFFSLSFLMTNVVTIQNAAAQSENTKKDAIRVKNNLNLGITVYLQKIQNNGEIILHSGCNEWIMLEDGGIVLKDNPRYGLTVKQQMIKNDSRIILHTGYNKWKVLSDGAIVLKDHPEYGLTVNQQHIKNNSLIILHKGYNRWSTKMKNPRPAPVKATGQNTVYVEFSSNGKVIGHIEEVSPKVWKEYKVAKKGKEVATFREVRRGPWSVFLRDDSRNLDLTLNMHTKQVLIKAGKLFDISDAKPMQWFPYHPPKNTSQVSYKFTFQTMNLTKFPKRVENNYDYSEAYYISAGGADNLIIHNALEYTSLEWTLEDLRNGYFRIKNPFGKYLSVHNSGKSDGTNLKVNNRVNGINQAFRFEQNAQGNIRIVSKLGDDLYVGHATVSSGSGNLILRKGDKGYNTIFKIISQETISPSASGTLKLFAEQYAAPVSNRVVTQSELNRIQTIVYDDGILQQISGESDWVRLDGNKNVVDVLKETSRKNGTIYLQTYNSFVYQPILKSMTETNKYYDISLDLTMKKAYKLYAKRTSESIITATSNKYYDLGKNAEGETCTDFRVITFRGVMTLAYATNNVWGGSDKVCSGGADREKKLFHTACLEHDKNWAAPWRLAGFKDGTGQAISDAIFLLDLKAINNNSLNPIDHTAGGFFYRAVRSTKEGNNNYRGARSEEGNHHRVIFTADMETKKVLRNIVTEEYSEDLLDDIFVAGEAIKNFFEEDVAGFFEDLF